MDTNKQHQEASLIGMLLSLEVLLTLMGLASLFYGIINGVPLNILLGLLIIPGVLLAVKARRMRRRRKQQP
jgi:membrane protein implicated in regulation of membrane protease activity